MQKKHTEKSPKEYFHQSKVDGFKKAFKEFWYDKAMTCIHSTKAFIPKAYEDEWKEYIGNRRSKRYKYIMFTVNFKPGLKPEDVMKKVHKFHQKIWVESYLTCFEWRKPPEEGMHIHTKVWLKPDKDPYVCKREVYNTFKDLVGNSLHVHARYSNTEGCFEKYICGLREDEEKDTYKLSQLLRKKYKLEEIYYSTDRPELPIDPDELMSITK